MRCRAPGSRGAPREPALPPVRRVRASLGRWEPHAGRWRHAVAPPPVPRVRQPVDDHGTKPAAAAYASAQCLRQSHHEASMRTQRSNGDNFRRFLGILISLALGAGVTAVAVVAKARAQSRYDTDQTWIRKTLRDQRREEHAREHYEEWREARASEQRRRHARWHESRNRYYGYTHSHRERDYSGQYRREPEHREARVYGFVARMTQQDQRDCRNGCCPPVENISRDHGSETRAWNDAQLGWMKAIAVRYGAMYADVQNADARSLVRQCFRSSFDESWIGRNKEALAQNAGGDGFKWTCRIIASPCIQPIQGAHETPLKGDERQKQ